MQGLHVTEVLSALPVLTSFILTEILWESYFAYLHFPCQENEITF